MQYFNHEFEEGRARAAIVDLAFELLCGVHRKIQLDKERGLDLEIIDNNGLQREIFCHEYISAYEWTTFDLLTLGVNQHTPQSTFDSRGDLLGPASFPVMSLQQCLNHNFSDFESYSNYCNLMFTLWQLDIQLLHSNYSNHFRKYVINQDDAFEIDDQGRIRWTDKFEERVMEFRRQGGNPKIERISKMDRC